MEKNYINDPNKSEISFGEAATFGSVLTPSASLNVTGNTPTPDPIDNPSHYADSEIQPKDFMKENFSAEMLIGAYIWNVIKYCARFRKKGDPLNDLKKAQKYLTWAIELYEGK